MLASEIKNGLKSRSSADTAEHYRLLIAKDLAVLQSVLLVARSSATA